MVCFPLNGNLKQCFVIPLVVCFLPFRSSLIPFSSKSITFYHHSIFEMERRCVNGSVLCLICFDGGGHMEQDLGGYINRMIMVWLTLPRWEEERYHPYKVNLMGMGKTEITEMNFYWIVFSSKNQKNKVWLDGVFYIIMFLTPLNSRPLKSTCGQNYCDEHEESHESLVCVEFQWLKASMNLTVNPNKQNQRAHLCLSIYFSCLCEENTMTSMKWKWT